mgnify:CR=1 FL=1
MDIENQIKKYSKELATKLSKSLSNMKIKEVKGNGTFKVIATTSGVDRDGESILVEGWDFQNFMKNPVILFGHNYWDMCCIVGAATKVYIEGESVIVEGVFANTQEGQYIRQLYDDGILKTVSVGFIPHEKQGNVITKAELLELSFVPVPANPEAISLEKTISFALKSFGAKMVMPVVECDIADQTTAWDETIALQNIEAYAEGTPGDGGDNEEDPADPVIDYKKYAEAFAWFDDSMAEDVSGYKLPHHDVMDGKLVAVWEGVKAAMDNLINGNSGIPEEDIQGCYDHLAAHYKQFEQTAPELKKKEIAAIAVKIRKGDLKNMKSDLCALLDSYVIEDVADPVVIKRGRVLSSKNETLVKTALDSIEAVIKPLQELLAAVNDPAVDDGKRLTVDEAKAIVDLCKGADKFIEKALTGLKPFAKK